METCESIRKTSLIAGCCNNNNRAVALMAHSLTDSSCFVQFSEPISLLGLRPRIILISD